jgi:NADPH:quinone reductase-like Zn-dependent oxidoreductase
VICTEDEDLCERVADIAGHDGVSKAIDCVSGQVGAEVSRALAPHGELVVYGALSTHRQTDPDKRQGHRGAQRRPDQRTLTLASATEGRRRTGLSR